MTIRSDHKNFLGFVQSLKAEPTYWRTETHWRCRNCGCNQNEIEQIRCVVCDDHQFGGGYNDD